MKKRVAAVLLLVLFCGCLCPSQAAENYDISFLYDSPDIYILHTYEDQNYAVVEDCLTAAERAFVHKYESASRYSSTKFDLLINDYGKAAAYPILRLWIGYSADGLLNIHAVTFTVKDKDYTFTEVDMRDGRVEDENGAVETVFISFGRDNADFLIAIENYLAEFPDVSAILDEEKGAKVRMVLHGTEDVEVVLGSPFIIDFALMEQGVFAASGGFDYDNPLFTTPLKITDAE